MEEDIKLLEYLLEHSESTLLDDEALALENLLKRYKELEEEVESQDKTIDKLVEEQEEREKYVHSLEELKNNYINPSKARISYYDTKKGTEVVIEGFIPISVIQNKRNEYLDFDKKYKTYTKDGRENFTMEYFKAKALDEILDLKE